MKQTPKEKAEELIQKFKKYAYSNASLNSDLFYRVLTYNATQCALMAVDEVIKYAKLWGDMADDDVKEFEKVKQELEKL